MTKKEQRELYGFLVCGQVLVTVREILALAPGIDTVRIALLRATDPNAYGKRGIECLLAATLTRSSLHGVQWQSADSVTILNDTSTDVIGRPELKPIDLADEPALAALVEAVDLEDLGVPSGRQLSEG
jgi:hypothetical protein